MSKTAYSQDFFSLHLKESLTSAEQIIPLVLDFIQPESVVDIGCGVGAWLSTWRKNGVRKLLGVDGDYVKKEQLLIDQTEFVSYDLKKKFNSDIKYDLVTSLEVGEHIESSFAGIFIDTLCSLGDVILFSAAIPGQQGTSHVNEQYPDYWVDFFAKRGFIVIDCLRKRIWDNKNISWWYRQNIFFFVKKEVLKDYENLKNEPSGNILRLVHPELLEMITSQLKYLEKNLHNPIRTLGYHLKRMIR